MKKFLILTIAATSLVTATVSHAVVFLAALPAVFALGFAAMGIGIAVDSQKPKMDEQTAFLRYLRPDQVNSFVYFVKKGSYRFAASGDYSPDNDLAKGLLQTRLNLKKAMIESGRATEEQFNAVYGTDAAPEFCAVSREAIAAHLMIHFGAKGAQEKYVNLYSTCQ